MSLPKLTILFIITFTSYKAIAQVDSTLQNLQQLSKKYIEQIDNKVDKFTNRITNKTEKTLTKLAKWEAKVKTILEKASPETAQRLFAEGRPTFATLLMQYKQGEKLVIDTREQYNEYRDKLVTGFNYLNQQKENIDTKLVQPIATANKKLQTLQTEAQRQEAIEQFIKERKRELLNQAIAYIGNSKYLGKISKESYYYVETIKNYKEIFSDSKKAEQTAITLLNKIPAFEKFVRENGMLAKLFPMQQGTPNMQSLAGLQTRASVNALIQNQLAAGGPNAMDEFKQNLQEAQGKLSELKDKVLKAGGSSSNDELPNFKVNQEKKKTFGQRLEYNANLQPVKTNGYIPNAINVGLGIGYKFNQNCIAGVGIGYKAGIGSIDKIQFSHQGIQLRSYIDYKLKYQFYLSGGMEMNYNSGFKNIAQLQDKNLWQQSGLIGISKKVNIKSKVAKGIKVQLLYDALANQHNPITQQWIFRTGYNF